MKMMLQTKIFGLSVVVLSTIAASNPALASTTNTVTFKDGSPTPIVGGTYTGTQDTTLTTSSPDANGGGQPNFQVGGYTPPATIRHALIRFDLSALAGQYDQILGITLNIFPSSLNDTASGQGNTLQRSEEHTSELQSRFGISY